MAYGQIIAGKYKGTTLSKPYFSIIGKPEKIYFNNLFAKNFSVVNQSKDGSWGGAIVGGLALGVGGAMMGASGKSEFFIDIIWNDDSKSLIKVDKELYEKIMASMYEPVTKQQHIQKAQTDAGKDYIMEIIMSIVVVGVIFSAIAFT